MLLDPEANLLTIEQVLQQLSQQVQPITATECVPLSLAIGRFSAADYFSGINVPAFDNSAVDGYAVRCRNVGESGEMPLKNVVMAGDIADVSLPAGYCMRIFTGAPVPAEADAVVMQEFCQAQSSHEGTIITFPENIEQGQNIRLKGKDIAKGSQVVEAGQYLRAQELGLLASIGVNTVTVYRRLKVAVVTTGDELVNAGERLRPGQIYNSNHSLLMGLLRQAGFEAVDGGHSADKPDTLRQVLTTAAEKADCVISCGGVSVGEADHVKQVLDEIGRLHLWRVAIKPGKPFAFGEIKHKPFIGLPGNPSSALVTFYILVYPYLRAVQSGTFYRSKGVDMEVNFAYQTAARARYLYVQVNYDEAGKMYLSRHSNQNSGSLSPSSWATGLAYIPANSTIRRGDVVGYYAYSDLIG